MREKYTKDELRTLYEMRESFIPELIRFGLNMTQIRDLSLTWINPFNTIQQVSAKIGGNPKYKTLYKRMNRKRVGYHNQVINNTFIRIAGQLKERGYHIGRLTRETKFWEDYPVRPDFAFETFGKKQLTFAFEVQAAKSKHTLWRKKLKQYVAVYEGLRTPFRVGIMVHSPDELQRAKEGAREALRNHPQLNLFCFALIDEIDRKFNDVVSAAIWEPVWPKMQPWPLVQ